VCVCVCEEHFLIREWNDSQFQITREVVKVIKFWIVRLLKTLIFGISKHLKYSSKILANTFSDSLAILDFFFAGNFFHSKILGSLPVPITLSITFMDRWCGGFEEPQEDWYGHCRGWVGGEEELGDQAHEEEETARGSGLKRYKRTLARADAEGNWRRRGRRNSHSVDLSCHKWLSMIVMILQLPFPLSFLWSQI